MTNYEYLKVSIDSHGDDCIVWPHGKFDTGYGKVWFDRKNRYAHIIALEMTIPRPIGKVCSIHGNWVPGNKLYVAHGPCHNKLCFNPRHLSWKTPAENQDDKKRDGTHLAGERHGSCTIPESVVDQIRAEYKGPQPTRGTKTGPSQQDLADKYGCSQPHINEILNGKQRRVA